MRTALAEPVALPSLHLIAHSLCPYVQRVAIALAELRLPFRRTDIDLDAKPAWLAELSPAGTVPVLATGNGRTFVESQAICEYLNDIAGGALHPGDPVDRARHRALIARGDAVLARIAQMIYRDRTEAALGASVAEIARQLALVEAEVPAGPYFAGQRFHLIDAVFATIFRSFPVIAGEGEASPLAGLEHVTAWSGAVLRRPSVRVAVPAAYPQLLAAFIARRDSFLGGEMRRSSWPVHHSP